jgi:V/A-type H+-transporting ATPase subunit A
MPESAADAKGRSEASRGSIVKVSGPVVVADALTGAKMFDVVRVGKLGMLGEVIRIVRIWSEDQSIQSYGETTIQVYEDTTGTCPGDMVENTGEALSVELGPGLLGSVYDGVQRPLEVLKDRGGDFIARGFVAPPLDEKKVWEFVAQRMPGDSVSGGDVLGTVQETPVLAHRILVPPGVSGTIVSLSSGRYTIRDIIGKLKTPLGQEIPLHMTQRWQVRVPRPVKRKLPPRFPLVTGQRVIDTFFPVAKGGTAAIPGPFGSGKTVVQQQLAKWAEAEVVVYVGCGERGNEMAEVLSVFPHLEDPKTKRPLMERTILIANTSNMPVAAREASIYTGITIAEYYRDMGYDVALMADSSSRWAEALREISGRLEEMPGEEGYPAYLGRRLAEFYERAGKVVVQGSEDREGSITVIGAVSPPGGDTSEPVSQNTLRVTRVFWALDASLANRRHFPAINWLTSYSLYLNDLERWYGENVAKGWVQLRTDAIALLQKEAELQEIVQLVGSDALPEKEKAVLDAARLIREDYLHQSAYDEIDTYTSIQKQFRMLRNILKFGELELKAVEGGVPLTRIADFPVRERIARMKTTSEKDGVSEFDKIYDEIIAAFSALKGEGQ